MVVVAFGKNRPQPIQALVRGLDSAICATPSTGSRSEAAYQRRHKRSDRLSFDLPETMHPLGIG